LKNYLVVVVIKTKIHRIFLSLSVVTLLIACLSYFFFDKVELSASERSYVATVKDHVKTELEIAQRELSQVAERLVTAKNFTFAELKTPTKYPYFIFQQDSLVFWSDYRFIPTYDKLNSLKKVEFVKYDNNLYLASKRIMPIRGHEGFHIVSLINIYQYYDNENKYLTSGYNPDIFPFEPLEISTNSGIEYQNFTTIDNHFLFSIKPPKIDVYRNQTTTSQTMILGFVALLFLGIYVWLKIQKLTQARKYELGFVILALYLLLLRACMLYFEVPLWLYETDVFDPKYYVSSEINRSLGDFFLNSLVCLALSLYVVEFYYRSNFYYWLTKFSVNAKRAVSMSLVLVSFVIFHGLLVFLGNIYEKSIFQLTLTLSTSFSNLKIVSLCTFVSLSALYFLTTHVISSLFIRLNPKNRAIGVGIWAAGSLISLVAFWLIQTEMPWIYLAHSFYFLALFLTKFPRILYSFRYKTTIYFFLGALFCAVVTTFVVYRQELQKDLNQKIEFAERIVIEKNEMSEILLNKANESIRQDPVIYNYLVSVKDVDFTRNKIQDAVKTKYLGVSHFDKYNIEVTSFDANGKALDNLLDASPVEYYRNLYIQPKFKTVHPNVYFVDDTVNDFHKQYISLIEIKKDSVLVGHIMIDLKLQEETPKSVYPELLTDKKILQSDTRQYSYALYNSQLELTYSKGSYNYEKKFDVNELSNPTIYKNGILLNDYKHFGVVGRQERRVVVSSRDTAPKTIISTFSFLFLILVAFIIIIIAAYAVQYGFSNLKISYTTKIQILLNIAFFLPLVLVSVVTLSVISSNYASNQSNAYLSNTRNVVANFLPYLEEEQQGRRTLASLTEELGKIAQEAESAIDVNYFDNDGNLYTTTEPVIYEKKLLSRRINPEAYIQLIEDKDSESLIDESLGQDQYRTAYVTVKSLSGKPLGVLSIPYFDSKSDLDRQMIEVVSSVLSIFAIMFLVFLIISYWASNSLTVPLRLVTQRIRKTNLYQLNQPLVWKSDDEIGVMVGAYNQMINKLEESKQELAKTEKVSAWQEMARQVAHEIKNPLTPMKLTIQQLQRTMLKDVIPKDRINRTLESIIDQIDNISDIATSFSDFAKMPLPKNELFEISSVLSKAAELYSDSTKLDIKRDIKSKQVYVMGDRQLIGRIITNLIINGIQSVPASRRPHIVLRLYVQDTNVYIEVSDNGEGIPEAIRNKVFFPNFSTKREGSGLGLALAKRGIEHANGNIWFESEDNKGTSFFISLPISAAPEKE
jgi:two-component system, NtrC family, nitrogen regulation sensor histidine kinase NtrY